MLEVDETSSLEHIKAQYRKLSKIYHPDISKDDGSRFKQLTISYEWLNKNHVPSAPKIDIINSQHKLFIFLTLSAFRPNVIVVNSNIMKNGGIVCILDPSQPMFPEIRLQVPPNCNDGAITQVKIGKLILVFMIKEANR